MMFHLLSSCWSWIRAVKEPIRRVTLLIIGLDNAGKTSLVAEIQKGLSCETAAGTTDADPPPAELQVGRFAVSILDLNGSRRGRGRWRDYYHRVHGVVFVLDSGDVARLEEARRTLARVLSHPSVAGKPLLLLANKQDEADALHPCELIECLTLDKLVNENKSLCRVEPCSATSALPGTRHPTTVLLGLRWLLCTIAAHYGQLSARLQEDCPGPGGRGRQGGLKKGRPGTSSPEEAKREQSQESGTKLEDFRLPSGEDHNPLSQKEDPTSKRRKKRKGKKKGVIATISRETEERGSGESLAGTGTGLLPSNRVGQENPNPTPSRSVLAGKNTKKKRKRVKKKVQSQEVSLEPPDGVTSGTFDLYRRAMVALKMNQGRRKWSSELTP